MSWRTAKKWVDRFRGEGAAGMLDRSSRPHHQPNRTPMPVVRKIVHLRWKQRLGPRVLTLEMMLAIKGTPRPDEMGGGKDRADLAVLRSVADGS